MPINVLTNRYSADRAGVNGEERVLTPGQVNPSRFGKLFTRTVDGDLYAQPLIVNDLWIKGTRRNVVFLATSRNWVYAYDAEKPLAYKPLWTRQLGPAVPRDAIEPGYLNFGSEIGITSTPAIVVNDKRDGGTIYVVAKTALTFEDHQAPRFRCRLHALDLVTGRDLVPPAAIRATIPGSPASFSAHFNLNRPGLLLLDNVIYLAFGSHDDRWPYAGWIMAYDADNLAQIAAYCTAPVWGEGGVWQSGTGLAADEDGFVYAVVGNGRKTEDNEKRNPPLHQPDRVDAPVYGNAILKLKLDRANRSLNVVSWLTAADVFELNNNDNDLIGGPVLFNAADAESKSRPYVLGGGKDGAFYLADREDLGGWACRQAPRYCPFHIHGAPVIWQPAAGDTRAFVWSEKDALRCFPFNPVTRTFDPRPVSSSNYKLPENELRMPGGILSLSWDGHDPETAVLWASHSTREDAMNKTVAGTLRAYDARDLTRELWTSDMDASGMDRVGNLAKFSPPVVANGKVYLGTFSRELVVYGMLDRPRPFGEDLGIFRLRSIGHAIPSAWNSGGKYELRLSGTGIGDGRESYLFAIADRDPSDGIFSMSACLDGINAPDYPQARAGLIIRRGDDAGVPFAALVVTSDRQAYIVREGGGAPPNAMAIAAPGNLTGTIALHLTVEGIGGRPGWVQLRFGIASPANGSGFNSNPMIEFQFDDVESMDLRIGLVATAHAQNPVPEHAFPAYARFSKVRIS